MTTVINNPPGETSESSGAAGVVIGAVLVVLVLIVVLFLTVPYFREKIDAVSNRESPPITPIINVQLPQPSPPNQPEPTNP